MCSARLVTLGALLLAPCVAAAGNFRRQAMVISMSSVFCAPTGIMAALAGTPPTAAICSEYVMVSDTVEFRIRPHKHHILLPVGEPVRFRFTDSHLLVRADDSSQDFEFDVISMELREPEAKNVPPKREQGRP